MAASHTPLVSAVLDLNVLMPHYPINNFAGIGARVDLALGYCAQMEINQCRLLCSLVVACLPASADVVDAAPSNG